MPVPRPTGVWIPVPAATGAALGALGRLETVVVAAGALALFAVYVWSGSYWIDLIDEGYFVYLGSVVQAGGLPYRDFDTYYTPGIFYLFAWTMDLFGVSVEPIRVLMSGIRVLWALLLYRLTRRVAPWPFAILPFFVVAAADGLPVFPEPHPSWPSMLLTLATIEAVVRHQTGGGRRWLVIAGALAGLTFAFKQNSGAFIALAIGAYLLLRERRHAGRLLLAAQGLYALVLAAAVTVLLWPGLNLLLALSLWLPIVGTLVLLVASAWSLVRPNGWTDGVVPFLLDGVAAGAAFVAVTLAWIVPLTLALGITGVPWGLFVGAVNQGALILPLELLSPGAPNALWAAIWLPVVAALVVTRGNLPWRRVLAVAVVASAAVPLLPTGPMPTEPLMEQPELYPLLSVFESMYGTLYIYLPMLCAWSGLAMLAAVALRRAPVQPLAWYLLAGTLASLTIYPRVDAIHAMFAGPPLFVVGAWGLAWIHRMLTRRANLVGRALVYVCLLAVPMVAALPHAYWRFVTIVHADPRAPEPPPYVELGLERAPIRLPEFHAVNIRGAVERVVSNTAPGEPIFAYPVDPMFYFLADRPNPTRHNHFIAGALTPADLDEVIHDLERAKPRYVIWDHGGVVYFKAELTNRVLHDYIWRCYEIVDNYTPYLILERRCP